MSADEPQDVRKTLERIGGFGALDLYTLAYSGRTRDALFALAQTIVALEKDRDELRKNLDEAERDAAKLAAWISGGRWRATHAADCSCSGCGLLAAHEARRSRATT